MIVAVVVAGIGTFSFWFVWLIVVCLCCYYCYSLVISVYLVIESFHNLTFWNDFIFLVFIGSSLAFLASTAYF